MSKKQTIISISIRKHASSHEAAVLKAKQLVVDGKAYTLSCVMLDALAEYLDKYYPDDK